MPNPILHLFSWRFHGSLVKALIDLWSNMILKNESPFSFLYFFSCPLPFSVSVCLCLSISCVYEHVHVFVHDVCKWCLLTTGSCIPPGSKRKGLGNFSLLPIISLLVSKFDFKLTLGFFSSLHLAALYSNYQQTWGFINLLKWLLIGCWGFSLVLSCLQSLYVCN